MEFLKSADEARVRALVSQPDRYVWFTPRQVYALGLLSRSAFNRYVSRGGARFAWACLVDVAPVANARRRYVFGVLREKLAELRAAGKVGDVDVCTR